MSGITLSETDGSGMYYARQLQGSEKIYTTVEGLFAVQLGGDILLTKTAKIKGFTQDEFDEKDPVNGEKTGNKNENKITNSTYFITFNNIMFSTL